MSRRRKNNNKGIVAIIFAIMLSTTFIVNIIKQIPTMIFIIIIFLILGIVAYILIQKIKDTTSYEEEDYSEDEEQDQNEQEQKLPYHFKYLLTKNEWNFYKKLKLVTDKYNLHIISKVRLADLVEVDNYLTGNAFNKYFWKIQAKHVDFVLCNPNNLAVIAVLELDDSSHNSNAERAKRDDFVDKVLTKCGYKIIHTYSGSNIEDVLKYNNII